MAQQAFDYPLTPLPTGWRLAWKLCKRNVPWWVAVLVCLLLSTVFGFFAAFGFVFAGCAAVCTFVVAIDDAVRLSRTIAPPGPRRRRAGWKLFGLAIMLNALVGLVVFGACVALMVGVMLWRGEYWFMV